MTNAAHAPDVDGAELPRGSSPKTLRAFFLAHEFPGDERARIAKAAGDDSSVCGYVLRRYATQTNQYKNGFLKHERIPGARPGSPLYRTQSIQRIIEHLSTPAHRLYENVWRLYREAASLYIEKELSALNELLLERATLADVTEAMRVTCSWATEYGVKSEQILRFYEVWGIPRVEHFEALLSEWMKPDEALRQQRQITGLKDEVSSLAESLEDARSKTSALIKASEERRRGQQALEEAQRTLLADIAALTDKIRNLDTRVSGLEGGAKSFADSVDVVRRDGSTLLAQVQRAEALAAEAARTAATGHATLESRLRDELSSIQGALDGLLAEVLPKLSSHTTARDVATSSSSSVRPRSVRLGTSLGWSLVERRLTTKVELMRALTDSLSARGVDPVAGIRLHAAVSANVMPVLFGPLAVAALDAYADVVFGGRLVKVHVTPALMEPADLFGAVDFEHQVYRPHRSRILDAVVAAHDVGSAMVVLEGINRGPTESYLVPLLTHRGPIQLFHETTVTSDEVPAAIEWPRGLHLAATCVAGPTSLPVSRDLWANAVAIEAPPLDGPSGAMVAPGLAEFAIDGGVLPEVAVSPDVIASLVEAFPEGRSSRPAMNRFARCYSTLSSHEPDIRRALVESALLPLISAIPTVDDRSSALDALGRELGDEQTNGLRALELRLRRCIT